MLLELDVTVVRIKEYGHNIRRIKVGDLIVLSQLQLANVDARVVVSSAAMRSSSLKVV